MLWPISIPIIDANATSAARHPDFIGSTSVQICCVVVGVVHGQDNSFELGLGPMQGDIQPGDRMGQVTDRENKTHLVG